MATTLFGQATPSGVSSGAGNAGTNGLHFTVSAASQLDGIWHYSPSGSTQLPTTVGLYTTQASPATGTLVTSQAASWSGAAGSGWVFASFTSPPSLSSGTNYMAAQFRNDAVNEWFCLYTVTWPVTSGILTAPKDTGTGQGWFNTGTPTAMTFPATQLAGDNFGMDVQVSVPGASVALTAPGVTLAAPLLASSGGGTVASTAPGVTLAAPAVTPSGGATVALTAPNASLAAPLPATVIGKTVALTAPGVTLAAPLPAPSGGATVALTAPNTSLAAPAAAPGVGASVALTAPNASLAAPALAPSGGKTVALTAPGVTLAAPLPSLAAGAAVALTAPGAALGAPAVAPPPAATPAFPDPSAQLAIRLELNAGGTWADVTSDCDHGPWVIGRGHPDESTTVAPSTFEAQLTNKAARYSPDNVMSDLWPWCVQNMPLRTSLPAASNYLRLEAGNSDCAAAADAAAMHVSGSFEVRLALRLSDWQGCFLAGRIDSTSTAAWFWVLRGDGSMRFGWWDSSNVEHQAVSDVPLVNVSGDFALKATMDASSGTVTFYTAPSIDGTYTQLGDAVTVTGSATTVRAGSDPLRAGWSPATFSDIGSGSTVQMYGRVYELRLYSGIAGSIVADGQFSAQPAGATSWTGADGLSWSVSGGAELSDRNYRGHFEASEWPQEEPAYNPDAANNASVPVDALVSLAGGGLLRRLSQRAPNVSSAMYRAVLSQSGSLFPAAYFPMEDSPGSTQFGSAVGGPSMTWTGGPPALASNSQDFACSDPLPALGGAALQGPVPFYSGSATAWTVRFLADIGSIPGSSQILMQVNVTGGIAAYVLFIVTGSGGVQLKAVAADGVTVVADTGALAWTGGIQAPLWWSIEAQASGSNVQFSLVSLAPGSSVGLAASVTTSATGVAGTVTLAAPAVWGGAFADTVMGHLQVQGAWVSLFSLAGALEAHAGEAAGTRFARLCAENGIACRTRGNLADTTLMGVQPSGTLVTLLQACADADQGTWTELRQVLGWGYVTRKALYNQAATATVSYTSDHLSPWSTAPMRDDQVIVNDVTYTNDSGSSFRMFAAPGQLITGGRMSTASPAAGGVGTYAQPYSASLASDAQLPDMAGWRLHVGTVDQARLPGIMIDLANTAAAGIYSAVLDMDLGDRLVIANPPRRLGFEPVTQICQALTETLWYDTLTIGVAGVPELPHQVVRLDAGMHLAPPAAQLSTNVITTATSWQVVADTGSTALWSTNPADLPQDWVIDGERVTVTAVTGASDPQVATVTRSVNGVVKSHLAGAVITAWPPPALGL